MKASTGPVRRRLRQLAGGALRTVKLDGPVRARLAARGPGPQAANPSGLLPFVPSGADLDSPAWMALEPWRSALANLDRHLEPDLSNLVELARPLPLLVWGAALLRPSEVFPRACQSLPRMAPAEVQEEWTGSSGAHLLGHSVSFVQHVAMWLSTNGINPQHSLGMDFGVGWGRLARLWLKFAPPGNLVAADAWDLSLQHARDCGLRNRLVQTDALLEEIPVDAGQLDFAWAFSVFTHLSEPAFRSCLAGLARMLREGGALVFTVRPHQYWSMQGAEVPAPDTPLVHVPDPRGGGTYGDTSVGTPWLERLCVDSGFDPPRYEWSASDPYQILVLTRRAS